MVLDVFPDVNILMIEGNSDHAGKLEMVANRAKNISFEIELLSDIEKKVIYYKKKDGGTSGNTLYRESANAYDDKCIFEEERRSKALDELLKDKGMDIDFIKLDVQGSEIDILNGGVETVKKTRFLLLEVQLLEYNSNAPLAAKVIEFLSKLNFKMYDIFEIHYLPDGRLAEIDILFAKEDDSVFSVNQTSKALSKNKVSDKYSILLNSYSLKDTLKKFFKNRV
jgi:FkbM family methyltransferase